MDLNAHIRHRLGTPQSPAEDALIATLAKCAQMRDESAKHPGGVGHFFADEFEHTIADALGIDTEGF